MSQAGRGADTQTLSGQARALLDAVVAISAGPGPDPATVRDRMVHAACSLTGAQYGALVVLDGTTVDDLVSHGVDDATRESIGEIPTGAGLLGAGLGGDWLSEAVRLPDLAAHPAAVGFPPGHPPMRSFLGCPVRVRGRLFGNLCVTEKIGAAEFSAADEQLLVAFAAVAGHVLDNAWVLERSEQRRLWLEASARLTETFHPPVDAVAALNDFAEMSRSLAGAEAVCVVERHGEALTALAVAGASWASIEPELADADDLLASATRTGEPALRRAPDGPLVAVVPMRAEVSGNGVLVARFARSPDAEVLSLLCAFVGHVSLVLDRVRAVGNITELELTAERERIARDLHDQVIQRLFGVGMQLQAVRPLAQGEQVQERIDETVAELRSTVESIRAAIFGPDAMGSD